MQDFPTVKVQIEGARTAIMSALNLHGRDVQAYADQQIQAAIENFDFAAEVKKAVSDVRKGAIVNAVARSFKYGEGAAWLQQEIDKVFRKAQK